MIRVAIVEDESAYVRQLQTYLHKLKEEKGIMLQVTVFTDGSEIVSRYRAEYDIILLDIQMRSMDGMTAAEHIRELDQSVVIIFITNMVQYAIRGYSVNALDYILKPVSYVAFSQKFLRAADLLKRREKKYVSLQIGGNMVRLELRQIYYIESQRHYIIVHSDAGEYSLIGTMKDMEERLRGDNFYRCNNCYLINLAHVESVNNTYVTVGGFSLQISRPRRKDFMATLTDYMGGMAK